MIVQTMLASYAIHFQHSETLGPRGIDSRVTFCNIHPGACREKARPCGTESFFGQAFCNPKDHFNRTTGRKLALSRALKAGGFNKDERARIWNGYLNTLGFGTCVLEPLPKKAAQA